MPSFRLDIFAWIPQPEILNPFNILPGGVATWGPGACGPYFGGDNFVTPPQTAGAWAPNPYRARQSFDFRVGSFGDRPTVTSDSGVRPGITTVLTAKRSAGGTICHSLRATVKTSEASVEWNSSNKWYEVHLHGAAQDPVPTAIALRTIGSAGSAAASAATPNLEWNLTIRFQLGMTIPALIQTRYAFSSAASLDVSSRKFPAPRNFGGTANLVHGTIMVRRFPSYIVYLTITNGSGGDATIPIYFADASSRNVLSLGAFAEIGIGQTDVLRQLTW